MCLVYRTWKTISKERGQYKCVSIFILFYQRLLFIPPTVIPHHTIVCRRNGNTGILVITFNIISQVLPMPRFCWNIVNGYCYFIAIYETISLLLDTVKHLAGRMSHDFLYGLLWPHCLPKRWYCLKVYLWLLLCFVILFHWFYPFPFFSFFFNQLSIC